MNKIIDSTHLYTLNKRKKKNKVKKLLSIIVVIEVLILAILVCSAFFSFGKKEKVAIKELLSNIDEVNPYKNFTDLYVSNNVYGLTSPLIKSIATHEYLVYLYSKSEPVNNGVIINPTTKPQATEMPVKEKIKYYQFSLQNNSYSSYPLYDYDVSVYTGIKEDNSNELLVKYKDELYFGNLRILNDYVTDTINVKEILRKPLIIPKQLKDMPSVLIYHTHTSEAYCLTEEDKYNKVNTTTNNEINVVKAGSIITQILNEKYEISTFHDKTVHDQGYNHNIAYSLSKKTIQAFCNENDTPQLTIDIHRDGAFQGNKKFSASVSHQDKSYAQIMFVIGADYDTNNPNPNWEANFKLAMLMSSLLEQKVPGISRGISMRKDPYNENLAENGLLIEIGFNGNLISEVCNSSEILAEVLGEIYSYQ